MPIQRIKVAYTTETRYSTIGRKNIDIKNKSTCSGDLTPKYGQALKTHESKENLNKLFN